MRRALSHALTAYGLSDGVRSRPESCRGSGTYFWTKIAQTASWKRRAFHEAFTGSQIVGYAGTHHILYGRRTACIDKPVTRYLLHKKLPSAQVDCPI